MRLRAGKEKYKLPEVFREIFCVYVCGKKRLRWELAPVDIKEMQKWARTANWDNNEYPRGMPKYFAADDLYARVFYVYPVPDKAYTLKVRYTVVKEA